jgi:Flp pilus assembly protein CpaB
MPTPGPGRHRRRPPRVTPEILRLLHNPLGRRASRRRASTLLVAVAVAVTVGHTVSAAEDARRRWGTTAVVVVAQQDIEAGTALAASMLRLERRPVGLVPAGALTDLPVGRRVHSPVMAGEAIPAERLARHGSGSTAARLLEGTAAISVPLGPMPVPLDRGDRVDVLAPPATGDEWDPVAPVEVRTVAAAAEVIEVGPGHVTLMVDRSEVGPTAAAVLGGALTVVLTG